MADPVGSDGAPGGSVSAAAAVVYTFLVAIGMGWLWLRDRLDRLPAAALGRYGIWVSMGAGVAAGLAVSGLFLVLCRYFRPFARLEQRLARLIGPLGDSDITVLALLSALGEEFLFRLAIQDALGLLPSAVLFAVLHVGPRGLWLWTAGAFALGLGFGWMMQAGLGLLSVTVAHALINYLSLRRMHAR